MMRWIKLLSVIFTSATLFITGIVFLRELSTNNSGVPQISMEEKEIEISVTASEQDILDGVNAWDSENQDVTDSLLVEGISPFVAEGERIVTIVAFDSGNNLSKATRIIRYTDYQKPKFSLSAPLSFSVGNNTVSLTAAMEAWDCLDKDITRRITYTPASQTSISMNVPGEYPVTFSVSNSAGDIEKFTATVEFYDPSVLNQSQITLSEAMIYIQKGESFVPERYISSVEVDGTVYMAVADNFILASSVKEIKSKGEWNESSVFKISPENYLDDDAVKIDNPVDTDIPGWYEVTYTVTSWSGQTSKTRLLVCVDD